MFYRSTFACVQREVAEQSRNTVFNIIFQSIAVVCID